MSCFSHFLMISEETPRLGFWIWSGEIPSTSLSNTTSNNGNDFGTKRKFLLSEVDKWRVVGIETWYLLFAVEPVLLIVSLWHSKPSRTWAIEFEDKVICVAVVFVKASRNGIFLKVLQMVTTKMLSHHFVVDAKPLFESLTNFDDCLLWLRLAQPHWDLVSLQYNCQISDG